MKKRNRVYKEPILIMVLRIILLIILLPVVCAWLVLRFFKKRKLVKENQEKIKLYNISQIDSLTGTEFEGYLKILFEKMGYKVELTKKSKDYGADLKLVKNGEISVVQAKCYSKTVGVRAVQEVIAAKNHYGASVGMVATNNYFSKEANILAIENDIKLLDRTAIERLSSQFDIRFNREKPRFSALTKGAVFEIEQKYKNWI